MEAFLHLRNALVCLREAERRGDAVSWLQACTDVRLSLAGQQ